MSRKSTGLVELYLGPTTGKRKRQSIIGAVVVEDYNSNLHGGRVVVLRLAPKLASAPPKSQRQRKPSPAARAMAAQYPPTEIVNVGLPDEVSDGA